jgi:hypothetical protein
VEEVIRIRTGERGRDAIWMKAEGMVVGWRGRAIKSLFLK